MLSCSPDLCWVPPRSCCPKVSVSLKCRTITDALGIHPTTIAQSFQKAASKAVEYLEDLGIPIDLNDRESLLRAAGTSLNSKVHHPLYQRTRF